MEDKIEYTSRENFGMIIPQGPYEPPKEPWFKIWREYEYWHLKVKRPGYPKWLDKLLKPLCKYGWHRWIGTFGMIQYQYRTENDATSWEVKRDKNYRCARCKQTKSIAKP